MGPLTLTRTLTLPLPLPLTLTLTLTRWGLSGAQRTQWCNFAAQWCGMPTSCHGGLHTGQSRFVRHANLSSAVGGPKQRTLYDVCLPNISHALKVGTFPTWLGFGLGFGLGLAHPNLTPNPNPNPGGHLPHDGDLGRAHLLRAELPHLHGPLAEGRPRHLPGQG